MTERRRRSKRWLGALLGVVLVSCKSDPITVFTGLEIVVAEGDGQFGTVGQLLGVPLRAVVRSAATKEPQEDIGVLWDVTQGGATLVGSTTVATDEDGSVDVQVQLGASPEVVTVRATVAQQPDANVTFTLHTVEPPVLDDVMPGSAAAGDTVTLTGSNFSPVADQNVVLFSGIRGRVVAASDTELSVEVPVCLPARDVGVRMQLGVVASDSVTLKVTGGGQVTSLAVGEVLDVADDDGFECYALEGGSGVEYLTLVYSASTVGAAMHPYRLTALSSSAPVAGAVAPERVLPSAPAAPSPYPQVGWDQHLRTLEGGLLERSRDTAPGPTARAEGPAVAQGPAAVPTVGESRVFSVLNSSNGFDQVTAVAQYVGLEAAIFVDQDAPSGGFTLSDLQAFAARFDDVIHPQVTDVFGSNSDLDGNGRVIVLFTPAVNRLTPRGSSGFIGGFFYGNDLLSGTQGSNGGEVFYALVPDPTGIYSDAHNTKDVLDVVPAVLAHEFQHMVQFNQRYILLDGGQEALWLSEGLAQMAEELVARYYDGEKDATSAELFRGGARIRARRYLQGPDTVSVIFAAGQGTLAEYGGAFLHVLYLVDQEGVDVLGRLSATTRTGVANVEAETGRLWPDILDDWWSAVYLDGPGPESGTLVYPDVDLRDFLHAPFPLVPQPLGPSSATLSGALWSSSVRYFAVSPDPAGSMTVRLGGEAGGTSSPQAALRMRIVRVS